MSRKRNEAAWQRIRVLRASGMTYKQIGAEVGVHFTAVRSALVTMKGEQLTRDNDIPTEKLDRMVEIAWNVAKRKWRIA